MQLTQDWGVKSIDGYSNSDDRETGNSLEDSFLHDTRKYLLNLDQLYESNQA